MIQNNPTSLKQGFGVLRQSDRYNMTQDKGFPMIKYVLALAAAIFLTLPAQAQEASKPQAQYVSTQLFADTNNVAPGQTFNLAIEQTIQEGWHVYWKNPGDSGEALRVKWNLPEGFSAGEIGWPTPERIPFGPLMNFGYHGRVTYLVPITAGNTVPDATSITANLEWLVCSDICIPETTTITLNFPVQNIETTKFETARKAMPQDVTWQGEVQEKDGRVQLSFRPDAEVIPLLKAGKDFAFFPEEWGLIQNAAPQKAHVTDNAVIIDIARDTRALTDVPLIRGVLSWMDVNNVRQAVVVEAPVPTDVADASIAPAPPTSTSSLTIPHAILFALLGGLILNLMPCVFPVLSMKALSLVKMSSKEQSHAVMHGVAYTGGILASFAVIAGGLIALQYFGAQIGWGFQLQNPILVLILAYILFLIGLNLFGVFEIAGAQFSNIGSQLTRKKGYTGSFFTGVLATIVATPCTAPFMGAALGFALVQPPIIAMLVFLALGLGLALPYLLLCVFPALRAALPKPGAWMETFKEFLAFPMFASAAWLVWVYAQQIAGFYGLLLALLGFVSLSFAIWAWKKAPNRQPMKSILRGLSIVGVILALAIAANSMSLPQESNASPAATQTHGGVAFTQEAFDKAVAGNDPVFVTMTASWCITCKVNERVALHIEDTQNLFRTKNVQYFVGDWTNQNPEITKFLESYGRSGVPLYVFIGARDGATNNRPEPVVLPQLLTPALVAETINAS
jgi:thiol:disulfide interchange protein